MEKDVNHAAARQLRLADIDWKAAVAAHLRAQRIEGVLIHGSAENALNDQWSDVDLLVALGGGRKRWIMGNAEGLMLDILALPVRRIASLLAKDDRGNCILVLTAFAHGRIVYDRCGQMDWLAKRAAAILSTGPRQPGRRELMDLSFVMQKVQTNSAKQAARAKNEQGLEALALLELHGMLPRLVTAWCRVQRLWAASLPLMLQWQDHRYASVQTAIRAFLAGKDATAKALVMDALAKDVLAAAQAALHRTRETGGAQAPSNEAI